MTAEAQSAVSADESQQSAVDAGERTAPPSTDGERSFSYIPGSPAAAAQTSADPTEAETSDHGPDGSADADTSAPDAPSDGQPPQAAGQWDRPPEDGADGTAPSDPAAAESRADAATPDDLAAPDLGHRPPEEPADGTAPDDQPPNGRADGLAPDGSVDAETADRLVEDRADGVALDGSVDAEPADRAAEDRADGLAPDGSVDAETADRLVEDRADGVAPDGSVDAETASRLVEDRADGLAPDGSVDAELADRAAVDRGDDVAFGDRVDAAAVGPVEEPVEEVRSEDQGSADAVEQGSDGRVDGQDEVDPEALDRSAGGVVPGDGVGADGAGPGERVDTGSDGPVSDGGDTEGLVDGVVAAEREPVVEDPPDDPWIRTKTAEPAEDVVAAEVVAAEVAGQLGTVVGEDSDADPAEFAAAAVLDVLRASGWADAAEATELRAESARLRELLAEVIRDHRAREASMAGVENQQLHWLVPLLRAAHGVAFGSLGAKVALRSAVQDVPPEVLASAGLRIDYGVGPEPDEER